MIHKNRFTFGLMKIGVVAAILFGIVMAMVTVGVSTASAFPSRNDSCVGSSCHTYQGGDLLVTTNTTAITVAPGASFAVSISFTGGGNSLTTVKWPNTILNNALFTPTPQTPFSDGEATATVSSTMTAPAAGVYNIRVYAAQAEPTMETDYKDMTITVAEVDNNPPTISNIPNQSTNEDTATSAIPFTVGDLETAAGSLTVSGGSSNTALVPNANIVFGGSGANRTVTITPAVNQSGTATITVTVSDGSLSSSDTFVLTVTITANTYTIAASAGTNGSITPSGAVTVNSGASQAFTIAANTGYHVADVLVNGVSVGAVTSYTFNNVTANHAISASFAVNDATADSTGPVTTNLKASPSHPNDRTTSIMLRATTIDAATGGSAIAAAEYFIDTVGNNGGGTAMSVKGRGFNSTRARVTAEINIADLPVGSHTIYVHGKDAAGNWGPTASITLQITTKPPRIGKDGEKEHAHGKRGYLSGQTSQERSR